MKKKLQVFISSTYEDMKQERQQAVEAILAAGHIPAGMELFASENEKQWIVIQRWIRESDVFLILLGGRYGSIEPTSQKSYIHREFEYAISRNKPIISIIISDQFLQEKINSGYYTAKLPVETSNPKYIELRRKIREKMSSEYNNISQISAAISRIFSNNESQFSKSSGWVSGRDFEKEKRDLIAKYSGIEKASIGLDRDEEFRLIRDRAKKEIYIIGAGMSKLARLATNSLEKQSQNVPIHLYMLDPNYLETNDNYAKLLEDFFGIPNFKEYVRLSFDTLSKFCNNHNNNPNCKHRISLSTYTTIPTMSMVIIDPLSKSGELVVEYFNYHCGEERPLLVVKSAKNAQMFDSLRSNAEHLFAASIEVIK